MEEWENQECSVTLTKGEWCEVVVDLKRVVEDRKDYIARLKRIDKLLDDGHTRDDSVKYWEEAINAIEKIMAKIESRM